MRIGSWLQCLLVLGLAAGCISSLERQVAKEDEEGDDERAAVNHTKIVDDIELNSVVQGRFNPRVEKYGYVIQASFGSTLTLTLEKAVAGVDVVCTSADAADLICAPPGSALDTRMGIYGPFSLEGEIDLTGSLAPIAESEDVLGPGGSIMDMAAPPLTVSMPVTGRYLVMFESHQETGSGEYRLALACSGSGYQCQRPDWDRPCTKERRYVQGSIVEGTIDSCETIVLESVTIPAGKTLTIEPGVELHMNYLSPNANPFGTVALTAQGTLEAIGTREHPIRFASHTETLPNDSPNGMVHEPRGWAGIVLAGPVDHVLEHVFVEGANNALTIRTGARARIADAVIEGITYREFVPQTGLFAEQDVEATFTRALVTGFHRGLHLSSSRRLVVEDSVVRGNQNGVQIDGFGPNQGCGNGNTFTPSYWRDPIFRHTDFIDNRNFGILVNGSDVLVQVERCNIRNNRVGIAIWGSQLATGSFVRSSNIVQNNRIQNPAPGTNPFGHQIETFHRTGTLDMMNNFWMYHSDPELSQMRRTCGGTSVNFSGFSWDPIPDAGPRLESLAESVRQQTWQVQNQSN